MFEEENRRFFVFSGKLFDRRTGGHDGRSARAQPGFKDDKARGRLAGVLGEGGAGSKYSGQGEEHKCAKCVQPQSGHCGISSGNGGITRQDQHSTGRQAGHVTNVTSAV
jgi:hypothetical protein